MIKGHGDDIYQYTDLKANFSSNVYHEGTNAGLVNHLCTLTQELHNYPEPNAESLAEAVAHNLAVTPQQVLMTNGATEAFYLLAQAYRRGTSLVFTPSFSEYEDACKSANHTLVFTNNKDCKETNFSALDMVWLCNPNNPDAFCFDTQWLLLMLADYPSTIFVVDEAYIDFISGVESLIPSVQSYSNLVVIRSMTKRYAIPALRLGYLVACDTIIKNLSQSLMPWRLNTLAIGAGKYVLSPQYSDDFNIVDCIAASQELQKELSAIEGVEVLPSQTTFFLVKSPINATELKAILVKDYGLLIRDASNFKSLSAFHFRVATQGKEENTWLVNALKEILERC